MIRVTWTELSRSILITLDGSLAGDSVAIAEQTCNEALSTNAPVTVFLNDVSDIDINGRAFLERMVTKKARLRAVGIFSRYVARRIQRKMRLARGAAKEHGYTARER